MIDRTLKDLLRGFGDRITRLERRLQSPTPGAQSAYLSRIHNGDFRINQRGYVSGTTLTPGLYSGFGHDRWRAAGFTNLALNPQGRVGTTYWSGSAATISRITGQTVPGLTGVTTAIRGTMAASTGGLYNVGDTTAPYTLVGYGKKYRITIWLKASVAKTIQPSAQIANSGGTTIGTLNAPATVALAAGVWTKVSWTATITLAGAARLGAYWYSTAAWAAGNTLDGTGLTITEGDDDVPFFDGSFTGSSWLGTADASASINRLAITSYTYAQTPQGATITLSSGGTIQQTIERADMVAGDYLLEWEGTALGRVYNRTAAALPAFAQGPLVVPIDGTDDVVVEFQALGGTATLGNVQMIAGRRSLPNAPRPIAEEVMLCKRYYWRLNQPASASTGAPLVNGAFFTTVNMYGVLWFAEMRTPPTFLVSTPGGIRVYYGASAFTVSQFLVSLITTTTARLDLIMTTPSSANVATWAEINPGNWLDATAEF